MLNLNRLKKDEIIWLFNQKCKHRHRLVEHPKCLEEFLRNNQSPLSERVGHLDIETVGLNANYDYIISYCIYSDGKFFGRVLTPKEVLNWKVLDRDLMYEFCKDIRQFDRVTVYWGKERRHDIPFLRSRAIKARADFPLYKEVFVTDVYDLCKNKLRLDHYRLENVCKFLGIPAKQHPLNPDIWQQAKLGNQKALNYIWLHNKEDVVSLSKVYAVMEKYSSRNKTSI